MGAVASPLSELYINISFYKLNKGFISFIFQNKTLESIGMFDLQQKIIWSLNTKSDLKPTMGPKISNKKKPNHSFHQLKMQI